MSDIGFDTRTAAVVIAAIVAAVCGGGTSEAQDRPPDVAYGEALAETNCARCHAVGLEGESPHATAPAFWTMSYGRSVESIARMLITKAPPKHSDMPRFEVTPEQAQDLAAWIAWVQPIAHGKRLAEANCAGCHAVGGDDQSSHPDAPAFRELLSLYPIDAFQELFAEGVVTDHDDMPLFTMTELQLTDMIAYITTLPRPLIDAD